MSWFDNFKPKTNGIITENCSQYDERHLSHTAGSHNLLGLYSHKLLCVMELSEIVDRLKDVRSSEALDDASRSISREMGFDGYYYYNIFRGRIRGQFETRTKEWLEHYTKSNYLLYDPVPLRMFQSAEPFSWDEAASRNRLTKKQLQIYSEARDHGLAAGFVVPIHGPGLDFAGLGVYSGDNYRFRSALKAHRTNLIWFAHGFHSAFQRMNPAEDEQPRLTSRERECLLWAARGKTNDEIGTIMSITENTVKAHISGAARKLDTHTKTQTVVEAIKRRLIAPW